MQAASRGFDVLSSPIFWFCLGHNGFINPLLRFLRGEFNPAAQSENGRAPRRRLLQISFQRQISSPGTPGTPWQLDNLPAPCETPAVMGAPKALRPQRRKMITPAKVLDGGDAALRRLADTALPALSKARLWGRSAAKAQNRPPQLTTGKVQNKNQGKSG